MIFERARSLLLVLASFCVAALAYGATAVAQTGAPAFAPGELVVRAEGERDFFVLELPAGVAVQEAARSLSENPDVAYAVPNVIARAATDFPNDPGKRGGCNKVPPEDENCDTDWRDRQWNFLDFTTDRGVDAPGAWGNLGAPAVRPGIGVTVAVIDTGVAYGNRAPYFARSPDFDKGQFTEAKKDWVGDDLRPYDKEGHGTHVAGTIAEQTDNGIAVTGLAYGAKIMPLRVLGVDGKGTTGDVARAIRFAANHGADVINLSLEFADGTKQVDVPHVMQEISYAHNLGVVIVAAAGNTEDGVDQTLPEPRIALPGRADHVIGVGGTTRGGCLAEYSEIGQGLDIVAPGGGGNASTSRDPNCAGQPNPGTSVFQMTFSRGGDYKHFSVMGEGGTSMSAAHVSGIAALVLALGGSPTPDEVEDRLQCTARDLGASSLYGAGLVDADVATDPAYVCP